MVVHDSIDNEGEDDRVKTDCSLIISVAGKDESAHFLFTWDSVEMALILKNYVYMNRQIWYLVLILFN